MGAQTLKRIMSLMLMLALLVTGLSLTAAADSGNETALSYEELPAAHRALYEKEMAAAEKYAKSRVPGKAQLFAEVRGDFNGYTDTRTDNSLKVEYTVSDSIVQVGERVYFDVNMSCEYPPMVYTVSGLVFDEGFHKTGDINKNGASVQVDDTFKGKRFSFVPGEAGYFNFVFVISDGNGNSLSLTTNTIQVYKETEPLFTNMAVDGNLGLMMSLDRSKLDVGTLITAGVDVTAKADPVQYTAVWTLTDDNGAVLDTHTVTDEVNAQSALARLSFEYRPLQAGKLQFVITASDSDGNQVRNNTPVLTVQDGFYFTAKMNRVSALTVGNSVTASYNVYGHECSSTAYYTGWECYDKDGKLLASRTERVKERNGKSVYTPRVGQEIEFYIGAICEHNTGEYPATASIALIGGLEAEASLTASTVKYGSKIGVKYSAEGGLTPYQKVIVTGYTYDKSKDKTYTFHSQTLTEAAGTVYGSPKLGDEVYFVVQIVEEDGNVTSWQTGRAKLTGAPEVTEPMVTGTLSTDMAVTGEKITLEYRMSGGSGTLNKDAPEASYVAWKRLDGKTVATSRITAVSGTQSFTPDAPGTYYCELVLLDGYHQEVTWKSPMFSVSAGLSGDADANGAVNAGDALLILQYDAGWAVSLNKENADVNSSGGVDMSDALLIFRYLAGEDVTLK